MIDKLVEDYRAVLVQIAVDLDEYQQEQLYFYCTGSVQRRDKGVLDLFCFLKQTGKMSWKDVSYLKKCLHIIRRKDLVIELTTFELKRDIFILLNFYVNKSNALHYFRRSSATQAAEYLVQLMERFQQKDDAREMIRNSGKDVKGLLSECISQSSRMTWAKLSLLIALAGEIISASSIDIEGSSDEAMEKCIELADVLTSLLLQLGCWDEFCKYVRRQHRLLYSGEQDTTCSHRVNLREQLDEVVQKLKNIFF